jgi:hypothetical protein
MEVMSNLSLCTAGGNLLLGALLSLLSAASPCPVEAAGVTIITHGFELDTTYPGWVTAMADGIPNSYSNLGLATTNLPSGVYSIYGKISDGTHTRYLYAPESVEIVASQQPPVLGIVEWNGTQLVIGVSGFSGQTIVLQSSPDLRHWLPLGTNTLTSASWTSTNNAPQNFGQQFYRTLLLP